MTIDEFFQANPDFLPIADLVIEPPKKSEIREKWPDADDDLVERSGEPVLYSGLLISRGTLYWRSRMSGNSDRFAAMVSLEQPAGCETTDTFWAGRKRWDQVYHPSYVADVTRRLKAQGVDLGGDKEYMPELARYRGDPEAVVPFEGVRSHIKKLLGKRGWACEGGVKTKHRQPESDPLAPENCKPLREDIIKRSVCDMVKENPDLRPKAMTRKGRRELVQEVIHKHGRTK
jgi:hypothetical protein